jgi:invasion protein IalB
MKLPVPAVALVSALAWLAPTLAFAQSQTPETAKAAKSTPTPAASQKPEPPKGVNSAPAAAPAAAPQPRIRRTETLAVDNWTVNCAETDSPNANLRCSAVLKVTETVNNVQRVVFTWLIGNSAGKLAAVLSMPPGVMIAPGVQLKIGDREAKTLPYTACLPDHCEAAVPMDEDTVKALSGAATAEVSVAATNGNTVAFKLNLKGFDQALADVRK